MMIEHFGCDIDDLRGFLINSLDGAWIPDDLRERWRHDWLAAFDACGFGWLNKRHRRTREFQGDATCHQTQPLRRSVSIAIGRLDSVFRLTERRTTPRIEIVAGLTTFLAAS